MKNLIVLALVLGMVSSASAALVYEALDVGSYPPNTYTTLAMPSDLNIGAEGRFEIEIQNPVFDTGHIWFTFGGPGGDEIALRLLTGVVGGGLTTFSPYMWTSSGNMDVPNSNPNIVWDPAPDVMHTIVYAWKSGDKVVIELDGVEVWNESIMVLNDWSTDGQHYVGGGLSGWRFPMTAEIGDIRIYDAIPEPATIALLGMGALALIRKRRTA